MIATITREVSVGMTEPSGAPLVVVLGPRTAEQVLQLARSGWTGPVFVVGSVEEAKALLDPGEAPAVRSGHRSTTPHPVPAGGSDDQDGLGLEEGHDRLRLDPDRRRAVSAGRAQALTPLEFGMLETLMATPGRVHRYAELTRTVWGTSYTGDAASVHAVARRLRRKLEQLGTPTRVEAVRGVGFRLSGGEPAAPVRPTVTGLASSS